MYKLMIVDDEYMILEGLKRLLDYKALNLEIVYAANNGLEALDYLENREVDVIVTDISMPGMTGLELIGQIKQKSPDIDVVIMSGYQEFDYARQAVSLGVKDYLVKPINKLELRQALEAIVEQKSKEHPRTQEFLNGQAVRIDELKKELQSEDIYFVVSKIPLTQTFITKPYQQGKQTFYLALTNQPQTGEVLYQEMLTEETVFTDLMENIKLSHFYGYSTNKRSRQLPDYDELQQSIQSGDIQRLLEQLPKLKEEVRQETPAVHLVKQFFIQILRDTYQLFKQSNSDKMQTLYTEVNQSETLDDLVNLATNKLHSLTEAYRYNSHVKQVIDIIRDQYQEELTLKLVSERLFLNAVYLGQIIKKETGFTFSELLNQERIHAAQRLLLTTDDNIEEICFKVGYTNIGYFYKIFKRFCNESPKSYRSKREFTISE